MAYAAKVPHTGYYLEIETNKYVLSLEVIDMDKNCVDKVLVKKTEKSPMEDVGLNTTSN